MNNAVIETLKIDALSKNLKKHFHDDFSMTLLLKGMCRAWIDGAGLPMKAGDALIVSPGVVHSCEPVQDEEPVSYIVFSITALILKTFSGTQLFTQNSHPAHIRI
jgi:quercetin dioxygenase-like cupin family protein